MKIRTAGANENWNNKYVWNIQTTPMNIYFLYALKKHVMDWYTEKSN